MVFEFLIGLPTSENRYSLYYFIMYLEYANNNFRMYTEIVREHQRILYIDKSFIINVIEVRKYSKSNDHGVSRVCHRPHTGIWPNVSVIYCHRETPDETFTRNTNGF